MAYIGRTPQSGNFQVCDAIAVVDDQAAYTMQVGSVNVVPESANNMIVSLNGVIQAPISSYTVSGSTITFASNLVTGDSIDFIQILGDVLNIGTPSDSTVSLAKLTASGTKNSTTFLRGDNTFAAPSGGVIQTKFYSLTTTLTATNTSFADLGSFSIDITPTSASNKIKLSIFFGSCVGGTAGGNNNTTGFLYTRDGTAIGIGTAAGSKIGASFRAVRPSDVSHGHIVSHSCIDAPSTTSQVTYKIQNRNETGTLYINRAPAQSDSSAVYNANFSSIFIAQEITP